MVVIEKFSALRFINSNGLNNFIVGEMDQKTDLLERSLKKSAVKVNILPTLVSLTPFVFLAFISVCYAFFSNQNKLISTLGILLISLQRLNNRIIAASDSFSELAQCSPRLNRLIKLLKKKKPNIENLVEKLLVLLLNK